jgi:pilus assembly protein CpaF
MSFDLILPFLKPIEHLLLSDTVSEIMVNSDGSVWMEERGHKVHLADVRFEPGALDAGLEVIANRFGKRLSPDSPILNLRLPDGSRLAAMIPPVVNPHPLVTIRKFTSRNFGIGDLISRGMLTEEMAATLRIRIQQGDNILIAGGTGTGKTTMLNVLADSIPEEERILVIEDTAELHIRKPHVVTAESQTDTHHTAVTFDDLLRAVLRHRPDRILVGEVRGAEARTLLDAMNTGHRGTLATIHASGANEAIHRLATLAMRSSGGLSLATVVEEVERCLDLVVYISRRDGVRAVERLMEVSTSAEQ